MVDDISEYLNMVIFVLPFVREDPHRKRTVQIALPKQKTMSPVPEWSTSSKAHIAVCWEALKNGFIWVN